MAEKMVMEINLIFLNGDVNKYIISNSDAHRYVKYKVSCGNNGDVRPGRCGGPEGHEM